MPNPEFSSVGPESSLPPLEQHTEELRALFTLDEEIARPYRERLWSVARSISSSFLDPYKQEAIRQLTGIFDWRFFGKPGEPLPEGLALYQAGGGGASIEADVNSPFINNLMIEMAGIQFFHQGMKHACWGMQNEINTKELHRTLKNLIAATSEYQLLASFENPERKPNPKPLNGFWLQVRQAQVEHEVRSNYGIATTEPLMSGSPARAELNRRMYHLENETQLQDNQDGSGLSGLDKARAFVRPFIIDTFKTYQGPGDKFTLENIVDHGTYISAVYCDAEGNVYDRNFFDLSRDAGDEWSRTVFTGPEELRYIGEAFAGAATEALFYNQVQSVGEALDRAANIVVGTLDGGLMKTFMVTEDFNDADVLLKNPSSQVRIGCRKTAPPGLVAEWRSVFREGVSLVSASEIRLAHRHPAGEIEQYEPANFRVPARLILNTLSKPLEENGREDLVLHLYGRDDDKAGIDPFVPGYKLVSRNEQGRFGFEAESHDQYTFCPTIIPEEARKKLALQYKKMGLIELGNVLEDYPATVSDLVNLIRSNSIYDLPEFTRNDTVININTLHALKGMVGNGKLITQCTGFAHFLKLSLEELFGKSCASVVSGLAITGRRMIPSMGHAQTVFTIGGKQYVLDATPPHNAAPADNDEWIFSQEGAMMRTTANAPQPQPNNQESAPETLEYIDKDKPIEVVIEELTKSFYEQAKAAFDIPTNLKLYDFLTSLPAHDPTRRTCEALMRYASGRIGEKEVKKAADYINLCAAASIERRKNVGLGHYSPAFLGQLNSLALRLLHTVQRQKD